jgi:hypothetical protein
MLGSGSHEKEEGFLLEATLETMSGFFFQPRRIVSGFAMPVNGKPKEPTVSKQHKALILTSVQPVRS